MNKTVAYMLLALIVGTSGCATSGYWTDRSRAAADVFTLAVAKGSGIKASVGPVHTGILRSWGSAGLRAGLVGSFHPVYAEEGEFPAPLLIRRMGCIRSPYSSWEHFYPDFRGKGYEYVSTWPFLTTHVWQVDRGIDPKKPNLLVHPYFTQIEVVAGLGGTVRVGFNPGELLDFILGWTTFDLFKDDVGTMTRL